MRDQAHVFEERPYWVEPCRVYFIQFILEGYDGLAMVSTLDAALGLILVRGYVGSWPEIQALLVQLGARPHGAYRSDVVS